MSTVDETGSTVADPPDRPASETIVAAGHAVRMIQAAFEDTRVANESDTSTMQAQSLSRLQHAVDDARDLGVGWEPIGDSIGIARGTPSGTAGGEHEPSPPG